MKIEFFSHKVTFLTESETFFGNLKQGGNLKQEINPSLPQRGMYAPVWEKGFLLNLSHFL